jgi:phenylpyruvate tautomerase PptA (4-oxalocrotonate tautomerase family)
MPLYTLITQDGALSSDAKAKLAMELTTLHSEYAGVPRNWVHVVFQDYAPGCGFTAGEPSATAELTLLMRASQAMEMGRVMPDIVERMG